MMIQRRVKQKNAVEFLTDRRTLEFFGDAFALKAEVLTAILTGASLADVALRNGVTREAVYKQARKARRIFTQQKVD